MASEDLPDRSRKRGRYLARAGACDSKVKRIVPGPLRAAIRRRGGYLVHASDYCMDAFDLLASRRDPLVPPRHMRRFVGRGDYTEIGREFLRYFRDLGGLQPGDRVLDVGSGIGRMAAALATFLSKAGSYEGLEIVPEGVKWCSENLTPRFPHFRFLHADIHNESYNPAGKFPGSQYRFPYDDASFDFALLTSVFTHMLPIDVENYLHQVSRVLKRNGKCLITFFLINEDALALVKAGKASQDFRFNFDQYFLDPVKHLAGRAVQSVAYDERFVRALYCKTDLHIQGPIHYGSWCGRKNYLSYQDIVLAKRDYALPQ